MNIILTVYFTGFIVCLIYDFTLYFAGHFPWGNLKTIGKIIDIIIWPISLIGAFILAVIFKDKLQNKSKETNQ